MSKYKISKTHRDIIERAVKPLGFEVYYNTTKYHAYIEIRRGDILVANALIDEDTKGKTSTDLLIEIIDRLCVFAWQYKEQKTRLTDES